MEVLVTLLMVLTLVVASVAVTATQCPALCSCVESTITCNGKGLIAVPDMEGGERFTALYIRKTNITSINGHSFLSMPNLQNVSITEGPLRTIAADTFQPLKRLKSLNLINNDLRTFEIASSSAASELKSLDLSGNKISRITEDTFGLLASLETLALTNNQINHIFDNVFADQARLRDLDLSGNKITRIDEEGFAGLSSVQRLDLGRNALAAISHAVFWPMVSLRELILSGNVFGSLERMFTSTWSLRRLELRNMWALETLGRDSLKGLANLEELVLVENPQLQHVHPRAFQWLTSVRSVDLSLNPDLREIPDMTNLHRLLRLRLGETGLRCGCQLQWVHDWLQSDNHTLVDSFKLSCDVLPSNGGVTEFPLGRRNVLDLLSEQARDNSCDYINIDAFKEINKVRVGAAAILECAAVGYPRPSVLWETPRLKVYVLNATSPDDHVPAAQPNATVIAGDDDARAADDREYNEVSDTNRVRVLSNGNLYIGYVLRSDGGHYTCTAYNARGNRTALMRLALDYEVLMKLNSDSSLIGFCSSFAFFVVALIIMYTRKKTSEQCVGSSRSSRMQQLRCTLLNLEMQKQQQMERMREQYNAQLRQLRDNYNTKMLGLRDSYGNQLERVRTIRGYNFSGDTMSRVCENYNMQVGRLKDYASQNVDRVRESYNMQVQRLRDYSALQLDRLYKQYRVQQKHVSKIMETLNIDNCKTTLQADKSGSILFDSEVTLESFFESSMPMPNMDAGHGNGVILEEDEERGGAGSDDESSEYQTIKDTESRASLQNISDDDDDDAAAARDEEAVADDDDQQSEEHLPVCEATGESSGDERVHAVAGATRESSGDSSSERPSTDSGGSTTPTGN
ncbi:PREDICTED: immunoglobulin domain and leucine-rich repeat-containing protein 2-like [Priapulus caudatus]|uniref:Immunoglobulin domain and leucine-rich repeat-containing protein 2-like n=1 Tax=Priapulus caudatus TaxID=37621 RepID=A0ABM1FC40_PRICU|nr:PREDICTED: immunoglobulin domain and leucine-rich repeat-containing protein 2-like [Priapulus caudatus]